MLHRLKQKVRTPTGKEAAKRRTRRPHHEQMCDFPQSHLLGTVDPRVKKNPHLRKYRN